MRAGQGEHINIQLAKLDLLNSENKLVKRRNMKPYWVVNITGYDINGTLHQKISAWFKTSMFWVTMAIRMLLHDGMVSFIA